MLNEILKQNGAYASVENNVGSGTTVKIFLPLRLMRKLASFPCCRRLTLEEMAEVLCLFLVVTKINTCRARIF